MKVALRRTYIATLTFACVMLLSLARSEQCGISLGVESAWGADRSTIGIVHRHRRSGDELVAAAVAATTSRWNYDDYYCYGVPYSGDRYYPAYPGGYCVSGSHVTGLYGHPTLFPRYYGSGGW